MYGIASVTLLNLNTTESCHVSCLGSVVVQATLLLKYKYADQLCLRHLYEYSWGGIMRGKTYPQTLRIQGHIHRFRTQRSVPCHAGHEHLVQLGAVIWPSRAPSWNPVDVVHLRTLGQSAHHLDHAAHLPDICVNAVMADRIHPRIVTCFVLWRKPERRPPWLDLVTDLTRHDVVAGNCAPEVSEDNSWPDLGLEIWIVLVV